MKGRVLNTGITVGLTAMVVVMWVTLVSVPKTSAIPAFSRKYQTSCTTCHSNYPELNDFGEAFKKNGFKFPKDDETFVKEPPVLLGSKAQKEASQPRSIRERFRDFYLSRFGMRGTSL